VPLSAAAHAALQVQRGAVACCVGDPVPVRAARRRDACLFAPADARDAITVAASDLVHKFDGAAAGQSDAVYPARGPTLRVMATYHRRVPYFCTAAAYNPVHCYSGRKARLHQEQDVLWHLPGPGCTVVLLAAERP